MPTNGVETLSQSASTLHLPSALPPFSVTDIRKRARAIQEVMKGVMKDGTHFGTIPGTPKPSLWKAGAEVLCMTFRLAPRLESRVTSDDPEVEWAYTNVKRDGSIACGTCIGFFEVEASCSVHGPSGEMLSRCSARCNNREGKYRGLSLYDLRNTILKMAEKRAFVSAVLMATGASDIFTQDLEDISEMIGGKVSSLETPSGKEEGGIAVVEPLHERTIEPLETARARQTGGFVLSPKREAWLRRVAKEGMLTDEVVQRCLLYLRGVDRKAVDSFFDDLARRKVKALVPFKMDL